MAHQPGAGARKRGGSAQTLAPLSADSAKPHRRDIIAAIATASGRAAIGVIRISGADLRGLAQALTGRTLEPRSATLTPFIDETGRAIDRGIALYFPAPASYTGEDVLELQGHGGAIVLQMILKRCVALGARLAAPGEFTHRAFLNGKLDLVQAEAVIDLIDAGSNQAARGAMRSLQGEFSSAIQRLNESLTTLRVLIEATLDFPEEEVDPMDHAAARGRLAALLEGLDSVLVAAARGSLLREGLRIVVLGRPNVGKSSLLNRLAGEDLAIVTDVPGTTRDAIRGEVQLGGLPIQIVDTAGLRDATDAVERIGVERTWKTVENADVVLLVADARGAEPADADIAARLPQIPQIRIMNKTDLVEREPAIEEGAEHATVWLSAKTGAGIDLLRAKLENLAGAEAAGETVFLARERHLRALGAARAHLQAATHCTGSELWAEELRLAHRELAAITGEVTADDLLGEIFSRFCIGK